MKTLPVAAFLDVVRNTPLVSIDLIIKHRSEVLLGLRNNRPAAGYWFVPGGRILKDETFAQAFTRITAQETGSALPLTDARPCGIFQHFYSDCFAGDDTSTHYVVIAMQLTLPERPAVLPDTQHRRYRWSRPEDICNDPAVHANTRAYFNPQPGIEIARWSR